MNTPYFISRAEAVYLLALVDGHTERLPLPPPDVMLSLLRNTLLLAQSISDNCREWLEMAAIIHGDMHPYSAEKLNIPTLRGALSAAAAIPRVDTTGCCLTCAFRVGSPANQTEATADDILNCLEQREPFLCHHVPENQAPKQPCRGFLAAMTNQTSKP